MSKKIMYAVGFTALFACFETTRVVCMCACAIPLLVFSCSEYIVTGEQNYTEMCANCLEFGGKEEMEKTAKCIGINTKLY